MENAIHTTRAILYFLYDKGISFDSAEINAVFADICTAWEHYWALEDDLAKGFADKAFLKVLDILSANQWMAEYFLTNLK